MKEQIEQAARVILASQKTGALTGAGISVESGIPDFRSEDGLWTIYDPSEYATISAFYQDPEKVWKMFKSMDDLIVKSKPNSAHLGLGELEQMGQLDFIITQNVDNLHQAGGSKNVIEYHGNSSTLKCPQCGEKYTADEKRSQYPPKCRCDNILKPDVVLFGEPIPPEALNGSFKLASSVKVLMVVGTSAIVSPANAIPDIAKRNGATIIEINLEMTHLTSTITDIFIKGKAGEIIPGIVENVRKQKFN
jgi:NAD-dependent deacetylase